ncbi:hypothetical protein D8674_027048 [Pyrus ussuriensis x Pyrus communis]|uniref:Uncharacterized protein n=1 Tax=Pyrus ussuriensis x Pyrus communis TaxID=2448454 RepID=A0A5N5INH9_9ROSA|nr:hypothetical protein D8674_027048 [Pyrus ussuriensis x Pyrus communis]
MYRLVRETGRNGVGRGVPSHVWKLRYMLDAARRNAAKIVEESTLAAEDDDDDIDDEEDSRTSAFAKKRPAALVHEKC